MESIKTEPVDSEDDDMTGMEGVTVKLEPDHDSELANLDFKADVKAEVIEQPYNTSLEQAGNDLDFKADVKVELPEEDGAYEPSQSPQHEYDTMESLDCSNIRADDSQGLLVGHRVYSSSSSSDSEPVDKSSNHYDSDDSRKQKNKRRRKVYGKMCVNREFMKKRKFPFGISELVAKTDISDEERVIQFAKILDNLRKTSEHRCETCALGFQSDQRLQLHNRRLHTEAAGRLQCSICQSRFKKKVPLHNHMRAHFTRFNCKICLQQFYDKQQAMSHVAQTHDTRAHPCPMEGCNKRFHQQKDLNIHKARHKRTIYKCTLCYASVNSKAMLNKHMMQVHKGPNKEVTHTCVHCGVIFTSARDLVHHKDRVHPEMRRFYTEFSCDLCDRSFNNRALLNTHIKRMHCGRVKSTLSARDEPLPDEEHFEEPGPKRAKITNVDAPAINNHNQEPPSLYCTEEIPATDMDQNPVPSPIPNPVPSPTDFQCDHCNAMFFTKPEVRSHILWSHFRALYAGYACACGRVFRALNRLRAHAERAHAGKVPEKTCVCNICGKGFETNYLLRRHEKRHSTAASHPCPSCDMTFKDAHYVAVHYKIKHLNMTRAQVDAEKSKRRPRTVNDCLELTKSITYEEVKEMTGVDQLVDLDSASLPVKKKIRNSIDIEEKEKEFPCEVCGKIFKTNALLRRHSKSHTGITYPCSECDLRFKDKRYVQVHYQLKHLNMTRADLRKEKDGNVAVYHECEECGKSFAAKTLLRRHQKIHQGITYPCNECGLSFKDQAYVKVHYKIKHLGIKWDEAKPNKKRMRLRTDSKNGGENEKHTSKSTEISDEENLEKRRNNSEKKRKIKNGTKESVKNEIEPNFSDNEVEIIPSNSEMDCEGIEFETVTIENDYQVPLFDTFAELVG